MQNHVLTPSFLSLSARKAGSSLLEAQKANQPMSLSSSPACSENVPNKGGDSSSKSTPHFFGRLRQPKSTFMNLIDRLYHCFVLARRRRDFFCFLHSFCMFSCCFARGNRPKHDQKHPNFPKAASGGFEFPPPLFSECT